MELAYIFSKYFQSFLRNLNVVEDMLRIPSIFFCEVAAHKPRDYFDIVDIYEVKAEVQCTRQTFVKIFLLTHFGQDHDFTNDWE